MHPMVKPALRRAWRDRQTVQFGMTSAHAVTVGPVDTTTGTFLGLLDGTRGLPLLREEARAMGLPDGRVDDLVARLTAAGLIDDATAGGAGADALRGRADVFDRLRPDLASLSVVHPEPGGGTRRLAARRAMRVQVRGAGRVGATIASVLAAGGVGRVEVLDSGCAEVWDIAPGGLSAESVGGRRDVAARQLVRGAAPGRLPRAAEVAEAAGPAAGGEPGLSLVIVAPRDGSAAYAPDPVAAEPWLRSGTPHLYAGVAEATGVVGPLVLPGGSACAGCMALRRVDRDPGWLRMLAQWRSGRGGPVPACDIGLATAVAGLAAAHALSFLDGELPATTGVRWEVSMPLLDWRQERMPPHPDCSCGAGGRAQGECASGAGEPQDTMAG
ncbi:TOMM precursor leader peptide-binding protein [Streptomyces sp. ISL-100]|uniref:TOMM precursor leader peptide-binding protein n=1 Tax=Streptomyces sp. ISL-100 TaxID=2819173 RepID=UPI001BE5FAB2|nr:TOMM precursor leader peptide-binding protein [Streptomyces sp. ISL-100]MBT2400321.1 TOMM precursor leader peptide-binding protein [Streptomyces sp. ISL-100]